MVGIIHHPGNDYCEGVGHMAEENVVSIAFADSSKAYQAFTEIKNLSAAGALQLKSGAIVVRDTEGKLLFPDGVDQVTGTGFAGGGLIGMLVGILGGPLGMLLGWGSGALIGGAIGLWRYRSKLTKR